MKQFDKFVLCAVFESEGAQFPRSVAEGADLQCVGLSWLLGTASVSHKEQRGTPGRGPTKFFTIVGWTVRSLGRLKKGLDVQKNQSPMLRAGYGYWTRLFENTDLEIEMLFLLGRLGQTRFWSRGEPPHAWKRSKHYGDPDWVADPWIP